MKKALLPFFLFVSFLVNAQQRPFNFQNNSIGIHLPSINTVDITNQTPTSASSGGIIVSDGGSSIIANGICWSTTANPTIANSILNAGVGASTFTSSITGLVTNTTYYFRAYATNGLGTSYGNQVVFTPAYVLGSSFGGGKIAYIYQVGDPGYVAGEQHGIIASIEDDITAGTGTEFDNGRFVNIGNTSTTLGSGASNTSSIIQLVGAGNYAASIARAYNAGGYSDWFLPSKDELYKMYLNRSYIGGFSYETNGGYWSSTETYLNYGGTMVGASKMSNPPPHVRAARYF
jgi:hypothetical protein